MFKPLLAAKAELDKLTFPMIASPKIDGIRCLIDPVLGPVTRTMKPIPNDHVRNALSNPEYCYLDGEIVTWDDNGDDDDFNAVQSKVMRKDGEPDFLFHVFNNFENPNAPYIKRLMKLDRFISSDAFVSKLEHETVNDMAEMMALEGEYVRGGYEGIMLRRGEAEYKMGRSTAKEGILLKLKRFSDDEAIIVGTVERMHNANEAGKDAFGRTERSTCKANMVPTGTLGALSVKWKGKTFEIGTGLDDATRDRLWERRDRLIGQKVTFKYQGVGSQGAPRFPVFLGLRNDL